jgi:hypothetical protein
MALTFRNLLDRLAEMEGTAFASWSEAQKAVRVAHVNAALRWAWKTDDPLFAFPWSVTSNASVTVTSGAIPASSLGDGTWCSWWESDPRAAGATRAPVEAVVSQSGVHPTKTLSTVFAFYRTAAPAGTYAAAGTYATPSNIPDALLDMVSLKALYLLYVGMQDWEAVNALKASYGDPGRAREDLVCALRTSGLVWDGYALALLPAAT